MKPGNFLMFMRLLPAFVVFVWGVEQSHAQNLSAPGQFEVEVIERINPTDGPAAAEQGPTIRAAGLDSGGSPAGEPAIGRTPPNTPKERSKPCR
jgi:hypothetical protein